MNIFWNIIDKVSNILRYIGNISLTFMMLIVVIDVIGRFFKYPIFGSVEITSFLAMITIAASLSYTYKLDGHVGVEILFRLFSEKNQIIISIITRLVSFCLFIIITWQMYIYAYDIYKIGEVSMNISFPIYYIVYFLSFCMLLFSITILRTILDYIIKLREIK